MQDSDGLTIVFVPRGRNGRGTLTVRLGSELVLVDELNLARDKERSAFAAKVCGGRPGIDREAVEAELLKLAAEVAARGAGEVDEAKPEPDRLAGMPQSIRAEARAMLESPDLLKQTVEDIGALGVAGEKELAATIYLVATSRLLPQPLAAIVQGPTSSGKSYVIEKVATLFPPEAVIHATQMTPQALFHMKPGSLKHRFIVAGERRRGENDETAEATRALREMLSSGRLAKLMPTKVGGEIQTVTIDQEGPISYVESTTLARIFDEDANRCLLVTTDEQEQQTRRIIDKLAVGYSGVCGHGAMGHVIDRHHALQRILEQHQVIVPFAERLGESVAHERVETRRAFPQLVSMIQASALLHQRQRQLDSDGRLLAGADDYQLARHLLLKPLGRLLGGRLSDPVRRFHERLRSWFGGETFTAREAARKEQGSRSSVYGWVGELHDAGLLEQVEERRGNVAAKWRLSPEAEEGDTDALLPPLEKVFRNRAGHVDTNDKRL